MVYNEGWEAKTIDQLQRQITKQLKEIDIKMVQRIFSSICKQLRKIADHGPYMKLVLLNIMNTYICCFI